MHSARAMALASALLLCACGPAPRSGADELANANEATKWRGQIKDGRPVSQDETVPDLNILTFQLVSPGEAATQNAAMALSATPLVAAQPFRLPSSLSKDQRLAATDCLTAAIYFEADGGGDPERQAIAQTVLNRVRHAGFPRSVCAVVFQGSDHPSDCQFAFTCNNAMKTQPMRATWLRAQEIAQEALAGHVDKTVGLATHYHRRLVLPYPRQDLIKRAVVGDIIFYEWQGGSGLAPKDAEETAEVLPRELTSALPRFVHHPAGAEPFTTTPMLRADGQLAPLAP